MDTILVFGDQLNRRIGALADADPEQHRILMVESEQLLSDTGRHVQRLHLVITAMRRFAQELRDLGFEVDIRRERSLRSGIEAHLRETDSESLIVTEPNSRSAKTLVEEFNPTIVRSNQFLCHYEDFAAWAEQRKALKMEDFYRYSRTRLGYLMNGDEPEQGRWNFDAENQEPPPDDPSIFSTPSMSSLDHVDEDVLASLPPAHGESPVGLWATSRRAALQRLRHFVDNELGNFGPYEDAMTLESWHLAHSVLSPYLNIGLLMPDEVVEAAIEKYRDGSAPLQSVEGFLRQIIGWREYVWGLYWLWPDHIEANHLNHHRGIPPAFLGEASTSMACVADALNGLHERAYVHHIQRLMVLSNFANLSGIEPKTLMHWMWQRYIDGAEWVMVPNVVGMALWADGGRMATKPYVSGGAYVHRMSDYCGDCRYNPRKRTGPDACPFTTLYWDFIARHRDVLKSNHRMSRPVANLDRLKDVPAVRARAAEMLDSLEAGEL